MTLTPWNRMAVLKHMTTSPQPDHPVDLPPEFLLYLTMVPCGWSVVIDDDGDMIMQLYIVELHGVGGQLHVSVDDWCGAGGGRRRKLHDNGERGVMGEKGA